jgi:FkbM family methyltransferase
MNPLAFLKNVWRSLSICSSWKNRWRYLVWIYGLRAPNIHEIEFNFREPVGRVRLSVRSNYGADAFVLGETLEQMVYNVPLPFTPETVLDLGANVGYATIFFGRRYPNAKIACVEPVPDNYALLVRNIEANRIAARVTRAAISISDGAVMMQTSERDYAHKVAGIGYGAHVIGPLMEVPGVSVVTLLRTLGWERIGLLKIDIEGYEGVLLRENAEWLSKVDALCLECHEGFGRPALEEIGRGFGFGPTRNANGIVFMIREGAM